jgi:soluble lytic murein transglycosylase
MAVMHLFEDLQYHWRCKRFTVAGLMTGVLVLGGTLYTAPLCAASNIVSPAEQQLLFWKAKNALKSGDLPRFGRYAAKLKDDPLYPYLIYWRLQRRLSHELPLSIEVFLQRYADLPLAPMLRTGWLHQLAKQGRWKEYLDFYEESDEAVLRCHYHYAQHKTGNDKAAWEGAKALWLVGYSQDKACDPLFTAWKKAGEISRELRLRRIEAVMESGDTNLARRLAEPLGNKDKERLRLWRSAYIKPSLLGRKALQADNALNRTIIFHTLKRRANRAPRGTAAIWTKLEPRYAFTPEQHAAIARAIAIGLTHANDEHALEWFARLPADEWDMEVCNRAVRVALRHQRWGSALAWLEVMPGGENRSTRALYWRGRIYESMGFAGTARHFYKAVSKESDYYGFLAADRINLPYNLSDDPLRVDTHVLHRVATRPDVIRAEQLYRYGMTGSARREWTHAIAGMDREEMLAASKLADIWGWEDRALLTLAKAEHFDDLSIRFPLSFSEPVQKEAKRRALDPAWIYAVVRQESAMMPRVQSSAGALGLMQVMPQTGREIARRLRLARPDRRQLLKPETNIHFGSYYLRQVLQQFDHNPVLATAAYNAGPHRIRKWYPKHGTMAADIWVESIPFDETREYVRHVMAYAVFYDQRLEQPITRLRERMRPVNDKHRVSHCSDCRPSKAVLASADTTPSH